MSNTIETRSGLFIDPTNLDPRLVKIEDIAFAAARVPRFSGWSDFVVGEHCLEVENILEQWREPPATRLHGLLHDAAECMGLLDFARPVKQQFPAYHETEERALAAIYVGLGIGGPTEEECCIVKRADNLSLYLEAKQELPSFARGREWGWITSRMVDEAEMVSSCLPTVQMRLREIERQGGYSHKAAVQLLYVRTYMDLKWGRKDG